MSSCLMANTGLLRSCFVLNQVQLIKKSDIPSMSDLQMSCLQKLDHIIGYQNDTFDSDYQEICHNGW